MLSLTIVAIVAYIVATLLKSRPIYESLLDRLLAGKEDEGMKTAGQKILKEYVVMHGAPIVDLSIGAVTWPDNCLIIAIQRSGKEIIPKGKTVIIAGDIIVTMTDERDAGKVHDRMEWLCSET